MRDSLAYISLGLRNCGKGNFLITRSEQKDQPVAPRPDLGGQPPVRRPGAAHEEARLRHGARSVRPDPVPGHLVAAVAPVHPDLRAPGGLLQRARPGGGRLDARSVRGLRCRRTGPRGVPEPAKVGSHSFALYKSEYFLRYSIRVHPRATTLSNTFILRGRCESVF